MKGRILECRDPFTGPFTRTLYILDFPGAQWLISALDKVVCRGREAMGMCAQDFISAKATADARQGVGIASKHAPRFISHALKLIAAPPASECFGLEECQDFLRTHLTKTRLKLFKALTGLPLHVLWHDAPDCHQLGQPPVLCPVARCKNQENCLLPPSCQVCLDRRWQTGLPVANNGRRFRGRCGATCFRATVQAGSTRAVTLILRTGKAVTRFNCAIALLRQMLDEFAATVAARRTRRELERARRQNLTLEKEDARLRQALRHRVPAAPPSRAAPPAGTHDQQLVQAALAHIHDHYSRPMQLRDVAAALSMNPSYLSTLFSRTIGVTFHYYLEHLRLARARELLCLPANRVCEVASAAGYASAGHFSRAFKAHTGLSPRAWRESKAG